MLKPNKLIEEQSPYLLQHAYNPVDWYPWGEEAFEKAKKENKPVFLSIGYSTCHWCHVMEKESFENEEVAKLMNEVFVSIKVDREERPDIDGIYMTVCQMLTGSGGWPLTIIMTPDKKPFFAGTYFPKVSRYGRAGMMELIPKLDHLWKTKYDEIIQTAEEISNSLIKSSSYSGTEVLSAEILEQAFNDLFNRFDAENGGFGKSPKFPIPHNLSFLLRYWKRTKNEKALIMVEKTLQEMRFGGIYDHIGFGFHRYSTDHNWLVPHFEKMLYDQALLSITYTEAYQATKNELYKQTVMEILEYVIRDMRSKQGGFYSAEDADSEGEEGKFYLWKIDEVREILGEDVELFLDYFNLEENGNWIDPMYGSKNGTNILHIKKSKNEICKQYHLDINEFEIKLSLVQKKLLENREKKIRPIRDDKILTDWNGLMVSAFAKAAQAFDERSYIKVAVEAQEFIEKNLTLSNRRLLHRYRNGKADISGNLNDYVFYIAALLDLFETTFEVKYLTKALEVNEILLKDFWDEDKGSFFFTASDSEKLLIRQKEIYDGAIPSGNSIALLNLIRLFRFTDKSELEDKATLIIKNFSDIVKASPMSFSQFLCGLDFYLGPAKEILLVGNDNEKITEYLRIIRDTFIPNKVVLYKNGTQNTALGEIAHYTNLYPLDSEQAFVYICENFNCKLPISTNVSLLKELN